MLQRYRNIYCAVISLLLMAWAFQSTMPIIIASLTHHSETAMHCDLASGCSSCQLEGKMECTCTHDEDGKMETTPHKVCGCSHHDGMATGLLSVSPLKAIFYQVPILLTGSTETLLLQKSETAFSVLTKDIFHPPRLIA